ncbi:Fur family transcriptional regulator [Streptomyces sp. CC208A]|uniref:Fur family transcriptional regulator n=1 Tax=Streptomyces sp. CC208A TaxID=3044573 RepID=UPI0024A89AE7|nr:Fur family transcriptional regulator [Streptomyces sp. CC208A]
MSRAESGPRTQPQPGAWRRTTRQREAVHTALAHSPDFVSAKALHASLVATGVPTGLTTVYRVLQALERAGQVDIVRDEAGERLYRIRSAGGHRHYLMCRDCGRSHPVDTEVVERWVADVPAASGFSDIHHTLELTGVCADCRRPSATAC